MGLRSVHQFLPALHDGDAIGFEALSLKRFFLSQGIESKIYAYTVDPSLASEAEPLTSYRDREDVKIYHFAIPSPLTDFFLTAKGKKVLIHHNITPSHFFTRFRKDLFRIGHYGRKELKYLKTVTALAVGDSEYNRRELEEAGFLKTAVFPLMVDYSRYVSREPVAVLKELFRDGRFNLLTVGRVVANKRVEDVIKIFFYYKKFIDNDARLFVVGNCRSDVKYYHALLDYVNFFFLSSKDVIFTGHLPEEELQSYYGLADLFITMSEHEGFCLPLVESMIYDLPIVAYDSTAISGTLGGAGMRVKTKDPARVGELLSLLRRDDSLRKRLIQGQQTRVKEIQNLSDPKRFLSLLEETLS